MLSGGRRAVMAAGATGCNAGMIESSRHPGTGGMAGLAIVTTLNMDAMLAGSRGAVVTTEAGALHLVMVNLGNRNPAICCMTVRATVTAGYMPRMFTLCRDAVMATETAAGDLRVIDPRGRHPGRVQMTGLTDIGGLDVARVFAGSG